MSSSDGQPPLTRRQARELERAREAGAALTGAHPVVPTPTSEPRSAQGPSSTRPPASTAVPSSSHAPASAYGPASVAEPGQTLSRRQLRALRDAQEAGQGAPAPLQEPAPEPRRDLSEALQGVDAIVSTHDGATSAPRATAPSGFDSILPRVDERPAGADVDDEGVDDGGDEAPGPRRTAVSSAPTPEPAPASAPRAERSGPAVPPPTSTPSVFPFALGGQQPTPVEPAQPLVEPARPVDEGPVPAQEAPAPPAFTPPVAHWSDQGVIDDEPEADTAPGRTVGPDTGQTNALILTDQQVADVTGALNATGEIIITGSIDLPRSLAATGSQAKIDTSDIDRLMEQGDAEQAETDAQPVRASRAISTHTSTRSVVLSAAQQPSSKLPLVLGVGGGAVGVLLVVGVVVGFATGLLG
ncbi:hypothetical protein [Frigoribacterium salinisoli]